MHFDVMHFDVALYKALYVQRRTYIAHLRPKRSELGRCTEALYVQRPQGKKQGNLFKMTTLWFGPLYICHFDFRSIKWVDFQISYLEYFSSKEKYKRTHL